LPHFFYHDASREIAQVLTVSVGTVNSDIKALSLEWKNSALHNVDAAMSIDLERINAILRAIWPKVVAGHLPSIDRLERLIRLRKEIFGDDKHTTSPAKDWQPITVIEVIKDYGPQNSFAHDPDL
jgi:hypothetical protein